MFESLYQSFEEQADSSQSARRVDALRGELSRLGLDGFLVPRADQHQNEYVPPSEERLAWLTGFSGSAGLAIVFKEIAAIFVDGRYSLAAEAQVNPAVFAVEASSEPNLAAWLDANLSAGECLGYDPWLHTPRQIERLAKTVQAAKAALVAVEPNPIDTLWTDRPPPPAGKISLHPRKFAGAGADRKLSRALAALTKQDGLLISDPPAVAWLLNIRGHDVAHTPVPLVDALLVKGAKPRLYAATEKLDAKLRDKLSLTVTIEEPARLAGDLEALAREGKTLLFDEVTVPAKLADLYKEAGGVADMGSDPVATMKACKNATELAGARQAQLRDGAAMVRFLHWFSVNAPASKLTEIDAAQALETFRRETGKLKDISFPTISAAGANSAIPHYRVSAASNARIGRGIFLIDSGGQYEDGTTDITRTLAVGKPSVEMRDRFTRVLKGHMAIARAAFPKGTSGAQIDALARLPLWKAGLDFDHGTGHGVGSYLSVHEGPQRIAKLGFAALEPGMILSNEPGFYYPGHWGIRIENLVVVEKREIKGAAREMLGFETLTLAPIELALIDRRLLDDEEIAWLNAYHARVRRELSPLVEPDVRRWLKAATRRLD